MSGEDWVAYFVLFGILLALAALGLWTLCEVLGCRW
jgi:hypothetical protein